MLTTAFGRAKLEEVCDEIGPAEPHAEMVKLKPEEVNSAVEAVVNGSMDVNSGAETRLETGMLRTKTYIAWKLWLHDWTRRGIRRANEHCTAATRTPQPDADARVGESKGVNVRVTRQRTRVATSMSLERRVS